MGLRRMLRMPLLVCLCGLRARLPVRAAGAESNFPATAFCATARCRTGTGRSLLMSPYLVIVTSIAALLSGIAQVGSL